MGKISQRRRRREKEAVIIEIRPRAKDGKTAKREMSNGRAANERRQKVRMAGKVKTPCLGSIVDGEGAVKRLPKTIHCGLQTAWFCPKQLQASFIS